MASFTSPPRVEPNPNPRVPLAAVLSFATDVAVAGEIEIDNGKRARSSPFSFADAQQRRLPVVGMRAGQPHRLTLKAHDRTGAALPPVALDYTPPPLPESTLEFPPIDVVKSRPADMEPGLMVLCVRRRPVMRQIWWSQKQFVFATRWSMLIAIDEDGEVVWYYKHDSRIAGIDRLPNGNLFFHQVNFQSVEIDILGNQIGAWYADKRPFGPAPGAIPIDAQSMHHQPHIMPNGNYLAMTANARELDNYISSETDPTAPRQTIKVVGDRIIEFDAKGSIVWSWNTFDHLDPYRVGYQTLEPYWDPRGFPGHADWTHGNGVCYDHRDNSVIMSLRAQDAVIKVDKASGEIKWILGTHDGWSADKADKLLKPVGEVQWPWHGHNPRVTPQGTIVMYDNAIFQTRPYEPPKPPHQCLARAVEYAIDEAAMEVRQVWSSLDGGQDDGVTSWAMGDAHRLPATDNMLVIDSFVLPKADPLDRAGHIRKADLKWGERARTHWHMSDFSYWARIREYKRNATRDVVFEAHVEDPHDVIGWEVFGGLKTPAL